jgi:3-hydroxyacyl-[acyl-carrier-protein] dehydratase
MLELPDIMRILPHRPPILLVDRVLEFEAGVRIVATKTVSASEPCYTGLADPLPAADYAYPTSLLIESFGQSGALLWLCTAQAKGTTVEGTLIFAQARDCVFTGRVFPGDVLRHEVRMDHLVGDNAFMTGETWVDDRRIATMGSVLAVARDEGQLPRSERPS